jgi:hypothetical protein
MNEEKSNQTLDKQINISGGINSIDKKRLLELLEDEEVKEKINSGIMDKLKAMLAKWFNVDSDSSFLKDEIKNLKDELAHAKVEREQLEKEKKKLTDNINLYAEQVEQSKKELENLKKDVKAYDDFKNLSAPTKKSLENILKEDSLASFIASGVQSRNIENLWDYINNELREGQNPEIKGLTEIFYFLFANFAKANGDIYELQSVSLGDEFDPQLHLRHNSSQSISGKINEIALKGMVNAKTKEIKRKSVVKI